MLVLPLEIWVEVFSFAVWVPYALGNLFPIHIISGGDEQLRVLYRRYYYQSLLTKSRLCIVCKAWRELVLPLLYLDIRLSFDRDNDNIDKILLDFAQRRLLGSEEVDGTDVEGGPKPVGWYTKRLDISWSYIQRSESFSGLVGFLQTCPRLSIFIVDGWLDKVEASRFNQLCDNLVNKPLLRLRCTHYGHIPLRRLYVIPSLTTLHLPFRSSVPETAIVLHNVTSLALDMAPSGVPIPLRFPSLQRLSVSNLAGPPMGSRMDNENLLAPLLPFFEQNCQGVQALHFDYRYSLSVPHEETRWDGLVLLLRQTPDVEEMILDYEYLFGVVPELQKAPMTLPRVRKLGLVCANAPRLTFIPNIEAIFPNLGTIQFFRSVGRSLGMDNLTDLEIATSRGIVIEDWRGQYLNQV